MAHSVSRETLKEDWFRVELTNYTYNRRHGEERTLYVVRQEKMHNVH